MAASTVASYLMPLSRTDASQSRQDMVATTIRRLVLGLATQNAALYHSLLLLPLLQASSHKGSRATAQAAYHMSEATRLVKEALNSPEAAKSDGTIAAVAFIAGYEVRLIPLKIHILPY